MAEWLGHQTCNLEVPASSPVLTAHRHHHHLSLCQKVHKAMQCSYQTAALRYCCTLSGNAPLELA